MDPQNRRAFLATMAGVASFPSLARDAGTDGGRTATLRPALKRPDAVWQKHGFVLEATEPWEGNDVQSFTCPAEPLRNGAWRFWYSVSDSRHGYGIAYAEGVPGGPLKKVRAICSPGEPVDAPFAVGNLPEGWRPVQVIHLRLRNGRHRIYFWAHGPDIGRYLAAESRDGRRYRVLDPARPVLYHPADRAAQGIPSPDGAVVGRDRRTDLPAGELPALPRLISNDAATIYQLHDGSFEMYAVALVPVKPGDPAYVAEDNAAGVVRVIDRYTSEDGLHMETRRRVIERDGSDPADQQFYYLSVTHTPKGRVGMLGHYRCRAQTMDLEWCTSQDGDTWNRAYRNAWLARGEPPAPDCYGIYAGHSLVFREGCWHLFYTGVNSAHNGKHAYGKARQVIMHATIDAIAAPSRP